MIKLTSVTKKFGTTIALSDINFEIASNQVVGFLGPNGAGKTTTMRLITSFFFATQGTVEVGGFDVRQQHLAVRRQIGYLPENNPLYPDMIVRDYLVFVARIRQLTNMNKALDQVKEWCGLDSVWNQKIDTISKGFCQRVGLAQALIHQPKVLILDEPTTGLDPNQVVDIRRLIIKLGRDRTVMLSTHILPEVSQTCHRAIIINQGKIVSEGKVSDLLKSKKSNQVIHLVIEGSAKVTEAIKKLSIVTRVVRQSAVGKQTRLAVTVKDLKKKHLIPATVVKAGGSLIEMVHHQRSLEDVFTELTTSSKS